MLLLAGLVGCSADANEENATKKGGGEQEQVEKEPEQKSITDMNQEEKVEGMVMDLEKSGFDVERDRVQDGDRIDIYFYNIKGDKAALAFSIWETFLKVNEHNIRQILLTTSYSFDGLQATRLLQISLLAILQFQFHTLNPHQFHLDQ